MILKDMFFVDFRRNELTNFTELMKNNSSCRTMGSKDVVALVSSDRSQIIWVKGFYTINIKGMEIVKFIRSERTRLLDKKKWNPLRVGDYARQAGVVITNFLIIEKRLAPMKKKVENLRKSWGMLKAA